MNIVKLNTTQTMGVAALLFISFEEAWAFVPHSRKISALIPKRQTEARVGPLFVTLESEAPSALHNSDDETVPSTTAVRAPLKFMGPYPSMGLSFPNLATSKQREKNVMGVSLDFVLDTAANTNTINGEVAKELKLPVVGKALPGLGAGGAIQGGST